MVSKTRKKASKKTASKKAATKKAGTKKAARKSFTTAAQKSAIKAATKTTKKTGKKAGKKGGGSGEVSHSPIIITDGSASIEFAKDEYKTLVGSSHKSTDLLLAEIRSNKKHANGLRICHTLSDGETVEIVVTCKVGGSDPKTFTIRGGNFLDGSGSPSITFDHSVFNEPMTPMATTPEPRVRLGKKNRDITKMEIFQVVGGNNASVHVCDVVTTQKNFRINVKDPHVH